MKDVLGVLAWTLVKSVVHLCFCEAWRFQFIVLSEGEGECLSDSRCSNYCWNFLIGARSLFSCRIKSHSPSCIALAAPSRAELVIWDGLADAASPVEDREILRWRTSPAQRPCILLFETVFDLHDELLVLKIRVSNDLVFGPGQRAWILKLDARWLSARRRFDCKLFNCRLYAICVFIYSKLLSQV